MDPAEDDKAYDVRRVTLKAARGVMAKVVIVHGRRVAVGDGIDVWFDTDDDRLPDIYLTGYAFSEYSAYKARGWDGHGRDISDRGCVSLKMTGRRSVVRFDPSCLAPSARFSVSGALLRPGRAGVERRLRARPGAADQEGPLLPPGS